MRRARLLIAAALAMAGCGGGSSLRQPRLASVHSPPVLTSTSSGRTIVEETGCLACHRIGADGNDGPGPQLSDVGLRLSRRALLRALRNPRPPMPSFRRMGARQLRTLTAYLTTLRGPRYTGPRHTPTPYRSDFKGGSPYP